MSPTKENAPAATRASFETKLNKNYKRHPAFGKALLELRLAGKMPAGRVIVTFSWKIGKAYTRLVLADDTPPDQLTFCSLAGLHVEIVYRHKDAHRVHSLMVEILKFNPASLIVFGLDLIDTDKALSVIKAPQSPEISEAA